MQCSNLCLYAVDHYSLPATSRLNNNHNITTSINDSADSNSGIHNDSYDNGDCRRAGMSHFQGWKKNYYAYTTRRPPIDSHALIITQSGFIPLRLSVENNGGSGNGNRDDSNGGKNKDDKNNDGVYLKPFSETLYASSGTNNAVAALSSLSTTNSLRQHCAKFSPDLKSCVCPVTAFMNSNNDGYSKNIQVQVIQGFQPSLLKATRSSDTNRNNVKDGIDVNVDKQQPPVTLIITYSYYPLDSVDSSNILLLTQSLKTWVLGSIILVLGINDNDDSNGDSSNSHDNNQDNNIALIDSLIAQLSSDVTLIIVNTRCSNNQHQHDKGLFLLMNIGLEIATTATTTELVALVVVPKAIDNNQLLLLSFQHQDVLMNQIRQHVVTDESKHSVTQPPPAAVALRIPIYSQESRTTVSHSTSTSLSNSLLIIFNQSASVHGTGWLQFPEELSSVSRNIDVDGGDDVVYEVLRGCGYTIIYALDNKWSSSNNNSVSLPNLITSRTAATSSRELHLNNNNNKNNNENGIDAETILIKKSQSTFKKQLKKYFTRSAELRTKQNDDNDSSHGIYSVYSSQPFGTEFLKEQAQLLKEGEKEEEKKKRKSSGGE